MGIILSNFQTFRVDGIFEQTKFGLYLVPVDLYPQVISRNYIDLEFPHIPVFICIHYLR